MKPLLFRLLFLLAFAVARAGTSPDPDFAGTRASSFKGHLYWFDLKNSLLTAEPKWESECPALTPKEAIQIASAQIRKLLPEDAKWMDISSVALERYRGAVSERGNGSPAIWIYLVTFIYHPPGMWLGPKQTFTIPLYLDGKTITPKVIAIRKK